MTQLAHRVLQRQMLYEAASRSSPTMTASNKALELPMNAKPQGSISSSAPVPLVKGNT